MSGSLITLPWRVGARGAGLAMRTAGGIVHLAGDLAGLLGARHGSAREENFDGAPSPVTDPPDGPAATSSNATSPLSAPSQPSAAPQPPAAPRPPAVPEPQAAPEPKAAAEPPAVPEPQAAPAPLEEPEPSHVSAEHELVEEVADPGAEDGAGAQVTIAEPWDGYRLMNADAVIDRLPGLTAAELAAVELYELSNRARQTLVTAVRRELKQRS